MAAVLVPNYDVQSCGTGVFIPDPDFFIPYPGSSLTTERKDCPYFFVGINFTQLFLIR
jgi:hypothetical protein